MEFGDSIYTITGVPPLKGLAGQNIEAGAGWHTVAVDSRGNAWDNWGFQGSATDYFEAMKAQNSGAQVKGPFKDIWDANDAINRSLYPWRYE